MLGVVKAAESLKLVKVRMQWPKCYWILLDFTGFYWILFQVEGVECEVYFLAVCSHTRSEAAVNSML